jgi:hypothetical protein
MRLFVRGRKRKEELRFLQRRTFRSDSKFWIPPDPKSDIPSTWPPFEEWYKLHGPSGLPNIRDMREELR